MTNTIRHQEARGSHLHSCLQPADCPTSQQRDTVLIQALITWPQPHMWVHEGNAVGESGPERSPQPASLVSLSTLTFMAQPGEEFQKPCPKAGPRDPLSVRAYGDQEVQPGRGGVNQFTGRAARAPAPIVPSASNRPGLAASLELTRLTAESGPATLPSPIVCKDKRDADSPTLRLGRRALGEGS